MAATPTPHRDLFLIHAFLPLMTLSKLQSKRLVVLLAIFKIFWILLMLIQHDFVLKLVMIKLSRLVFCSYSLFSKLPPQGDNEAILRSWSHAVTCPPVYHARWKHQTILFHCWTSKIVFGWPDRESNPSFAFIVADALAPRSLIVFDCIAFHWYYLNQLQHWVPIHAAMEEVAQEMRVQGNAPVVFAGWASLEIYAK